MLSVVRDVPVPWPLHPALLEVELRLDHLFMEYEYELAICVMPSGRVSVRGRVDVSYVYLSID